MSQRGDFSDGGLQSSPASELPLSQCIGSLAHTRHDRTSISACLLAVLIKWKWCQYTWTWTCTFIWGMFWCTQDQTTIRHVQCNSLIQDVVASLFVHPIFLQPDINQEKLWVQAGILDLSPVLCGVIQMVRLEGQNMQLEVIVTMLETLYTSAAASSNRHVQVELQLIACSSEIC